MDGLICYVFQVKGTVILTDAEGAFVDISAKSSAFLPLHEASICKVKHVSEAGIYPGLQEEFLVIGGDTRDDKLIISLRLIQSDLAWERCQQLQAKDVVIKGKVGTKFNRRLFHLMDNLLFFFGLS